MALFLDVGDRFYRIVMNRNSICLLHNKYYENVYNKTGLWDFSFLHRIHNFLHLDRDFYKSSRAFLFLVTWYQNRILKYEKRQYSSLKSFSFFVKELSINLHDSCLFSISFKNKSHTRKGRNVQITKACPC